MTGTAHTEALERELAAQFGVRHAVAVASGTAALHTALAALDLGPGDDVLVPALSVVMSVAPVIHAGARPIFVDCTPDGTDFDHDDLATKITAATRAILPVHLWGRVGDSVRLLRLARRYGVDVVEDACQAQGTQVGGRHAGTFGTIGCFSMKDGKVLWSGEGGYLLTDRDDLYAYARSFRSHHQPPYPGVRATRPGHNYRLAEPLAAVARANLARFDALLARRRRQAGLLRELLSGTPGIEVVDVSAEQQWNGYSLLASVTLPAPRAFCEHLARQGVPNSVGTFRLVPADRQPVFAGLPTTPCRNAAAVVDRTLAVVLNDHDHDGRLDRYAKTIIREARRWHRPC
ncbi:dTDP-4-amino-4,6-dideoxygalactose transaminase [Micromonospora sp. Llam0]|uniref:DegT/DnrJ/EryC1/StrS family aminotransferase n=1 Tax=Micromonospora sp. Llam0 TaxID=2485143 RepID=UPI000F9A1F56|nr:aminotransferase class I/II-fold pyridoxal phosphate-dependent enzyme [Micromonospora sp. Llam0]ROO51621.1 dTDP-4-amino-4,6-dideoxygalactose transaminase [Micromonospora sp. Llam0]